MEQIRLIKEMRARDESDGRTGIDVFPRWMVWENVYGAFSSNGGEDFRAVLEEVAKVAGKSAVIPKYEGGAWRPSGVILGDGWSIAWRTHDAQHWSVPQRRRRISLIADFNGHTAPWITFDCAWREADLHDQSAAVGYIGRESGPEVQFIAESLFGDFTEGGEARERTPGDFAGGVGETGGAMNPWDPQSERVYGADRVWHSLNANESGGQSRDAVCYGFKLGQGEKAHGMAFEQEKAPTLNAECGGNKPAVLCGVDLYNGTIADEVAATLGASSGNANTASPKVLVFSQNGSGDVVVSENCYSITTRQNPCGRGTGMIFGFQPQAGGNTGCAIGYDRAPCLGVTQKPAVYDARGNGDGRVVPTITGDHENRVTDYTAVCCGTDSPYIAGTLDASYYKGVGARNGQERTVVAVDCRNGRETEINGTLQAKDSGGTSLNLNNVCREGTMVRRLTPLECERLQGYPDGWVFIGDWTDENGKKHKQADAPMYKALGNSIALPFWFWLLNRISAFCMEKTMGSLFDGIGGFPLCWQMINGDGSCRWSSEIESFCIAVTTKHFGDEEKGIKGDWMDYVKFGNDES